MPEQQLSERQALAEEISLLEELNRRRAMGYEPECCVFFIKNYLQTFDPRPEAYPHHLDFNLYPFQEEYVIDTVNAIRKGEDIFDEKSRDMGASWLALSVRFWMWLREEGYQSLLGSRKEEYVDSGDAKSLFWKLDYFILTIKDRKLLPEGFDKRRHRTYMKLINPLNGNAITGESSNRDFSRGGRYTDILYDELGFWPDAKNSWTAGGDATHCRHAVTTPPNEPSFAKALRQGGKIRVRTWHWRLHPNKDDEWYQREKTRRTEEEVLHEIDISWEYTSTGRPYPEVDKIPFGHYPYDPTAPLYISIDLGLDAIALGYYQPVPNTDWITLVDAYEVSDQIIDWILPMLGKDIDSRFIYKDSDLEFIEAIRLWKPPIMFGDPSGKQRHVESGVAPYTILREHGLYVQVNDEENNWPPRRDATKKLLPRLRVNETPRTKWWAECLKNSRYPKRDPETSQSVTPITKPVHDWTSHHRTQTEFFAVNYKAPIDDGELPEIELPGGQWVGMR